MSIIENGFEIESDVFYVFDANKPISAVYAGKEFNHSFIQDERIMKDYEIYFVINGDIYVEQNNIKSHAKKFQCLLNFPYMKQVGLKVAPASFYWLHFLPSEAPQKYNKEELREIIKNDDNFIDSHYIIPYHITIDSIDSFSLLINLYIKSLLEIRNKLIEDSYMKAILAELTKQVTISNLSTNRQIPLRVSQIIEYIDLYFKNVQSVKDLAIKFEYNDKYLSYLFKKYLNTSPKQYLEEVKIFHAEAILRDTPLPIKDVASAVGYYDPHHFMRVYKKLRGYTPTTYRLKVSKNIKNI